MIGMNVAIYGFQTVISEVVKIGKDILIAWFGSVCGLSFNNFMDGLIQLILPVQEKELQTQSEITTYRFLLTLFLLSVLVAVTTFMSIESFPTCSSPSSMDDNDSSCRPNNRLNYSQRYGSSQLRSSSSNYTTN